jgi:hypothetical protein
MLTSISERPRSKPGPGPVPATDPEPAPAPAADTAGTAWVEPDDMACPATHPVKAKVGSGIYHLPGMSAYDRTRPDRCYPDETAAEADGFTKAKR